MAQRRESKSRYLRRTVVVLPILVVVAVVGANVMRNSPPLKPSASPVLPPALQTPSLKLAKEYIYAGDRLLATEEQGLESPVVG